MENENKLKEVILPYLPKSADPSNKMNMPLGIYFLYFEDGESCVVKGRADYIEEWLKQTRAGKRHIQFATWWNKGKVRRIICIKAQTAEFSVHILHCTKHTEERNDSSVPSNLKGRSYYKIVATLKPKEGKTVIMTKCVRKLPRKWLPEYTMEYWVGRNNTTIVKNK